MSPPTTRQVVARLLDADSLSGLVEAPVRAGHLRIKPGVSVSMSLRRTDDGTAAGWARVLWPSAHAKAANSQRRALRLGLTTRLVALDGGLLLEHGDVVADPRLGRVVARALTEGILDPWEPAAVLRHNPLRRLVVAQRDEVVKVWARSRPHARAWHRLLGQALAVPEEICRAAVPTELDGHLSVQRRVGDSDLARHPDPAGTRAAGGLLAQLHALGAEAPAELTARLGALPAPARLARVHADLLKALDTGLARRVTTLARQLPEPGLGEPAVLSHGDASPDQVLVDRRTSRVWLTDFDRLCLAPAAADLGAYLAEAGPGAAPDLLAGYTAHGGRPPSGPALDRAVRASLLARLMDPLRRADPAWRSRVAACLTTLEEDETWMP